MGYYKERGNCLAQLREMWKICLQGGEAGQFAAGLPDAIL